MTGTGAYPASDTSNANFTVVDVPWVAVANTVLFFVADDAVGASNVTAQSDRKGGTTLTDAGSPFLTRQGGGRRYGNSSLTTGAALIRTGSLPSSTGSGVLHGMLLSQTLDGLGWFYDFGGQHSDLRVFVDGTNIYLRGLRNGSGTLVRSRPHGGITNGVRHSFGWSASGTSGSATEFFLDGVSLGVHTTLGEQFGVNTTPGGTVANVKTHIGSRDYATGGSGSSVQTRGVFIAGQLTDGKMTAAEHIAVHNYMLTLPI